MFDTDFGVLMFGLLLYMVIIFKFMSACKRAELLKLTRFGNPLLVGGLKPVYNYVAIVLYKPLRVNA